MTNGWVEAGFIYFDQQLIATIMTRAPSTLPFPLEPNPSPQQLHAAQQAQQAQLQSQLQPQLPSQSPQQTDRYMSNICRAGPMPQSRHSITDPICLILYLLLLVSTLTLFLINFFSGKLASTLNLSQLNFLQLLTYSLNETLPETMLVCACLVVIGILFVLLVLALPVLMGFLVLAGCVGFLGFVVYSLLVLQWGNVFYTGNAGSPSQQDIERESNLFRICLIVVTCLGLAAALFLIFSRFRKLKHLPAMMAVVKVVLLANMPVFPMVILFLFNGISMGLWCGFARMLWNCTRMQLSSQLPIAPVLVTIMVIVLWLWTHGLMIASSDYVCEAWVIHWYYNARADSDAGQGALRASWRRFIFKKLLRYHLGTVLYGAIVSTYSFQALAKLVRRFLKTRASKPGLLQNIGYLSRYCYIETIMQSLNFCTSNRQMFLLRQRIKEKIPEIYMLGHFLEQTIKILLPISAVYLWFIFTYKLANFLDETVVNFTPWLFLIFCFIVSMGIFLEISTNVGHLFGIVSDTAVIVYCIDCEIERVHYSGNRAHSVPDGLREALMKLEVELKLENYRPAAANPGMAEANVDYLHMPSNNQYQNVPGMEH